MRTAMFFGTLMVCDAFRTYPTGIPATVMTLVFLVFLVMDAAEILRRK